MKTSEKIRITLRSILRIPFVIAACMFGIVVVPIVWLLEGSPPFWERDGGIWKSYYKVIKGGKN